MNAPIQGSAADIIKIAMVNVYTRLKKEGLKAKLVLQVHDELIVEAPDGERELASKILKEDCEINFSKDCDTVHNLIRGLSPIPLSFTHTPDGKLLKVVESEICERESENNDFGKVVSIENGKIRVLCAHGSINILKVLPEGKGKMSSADFIRGRKISAGDILK
jgi:methionyl-tRNA formyltransferase